MMRPLVCYRQGHWRIVWRNAEHKIRWTSFFKYATLRDAYAVAHYLSGGK